MYIIHVEDDHLQAEWLHSSLKTEFPHANIEHISTELDFYERLDSLDHLPDVFIIDVMLRWTNPSIDMQPPPKNVELEGHYRAGFRCERKIAEHETARTVPVILYSVLERNDLEQELKNIPENVTYLTKEYTLGKLIQEIRSLNV
jgi:hypothetical protein